MGREKKTHKLFIKKNWLNIMFFFALDSFFVFFAIFWTLAYLDSLSLSLAHYYDYWLINVFFSCCVDFRFFSFHYLMILLNFSLESVLSCFFLNFDQNFRIEWNKMIRFICQFYFIGSAHTNRNERIKKIPTYFLLNWIIIIIIIIIFWKKTKWSFCVCVIHIYFI